MNTDKGFQQENNIIKTTITALPDIPGSPPPANDLSPHTGLDRMSILIDSLGTLRIIFDNAVKLNSGLDVSDCEALAAFMVLLEENFGEAIDHLYQDIK